MLARRVGPSRASRRRPDGASSPMSYPQTERRAPFQRLPPRRIAMLSLNGNRSAVQLAGCAALHRHLALACDCEWVDPARTIAWSHQRDVGWSRRIAALMLCHGGSRRSAESARPLWRRRANPDRARAGRRRAIGFAHKHGAIPLRTLTRLSRHGGALDAEVSRCARHPSCGGLGRQPSVSRVLTGRSRPGSVGAGHASERR